MQIIKGTITQLASKGYLTLQIPDVSLGAVPRCGPEWEEAPDEWFVSLKASGHPVTSNRETGYRYLSRKGWEANKDALKRAFVGNPRANTWEDMEAHVAEHFAKVERKTQEYLRQLREKIAAIEKVTL